MRDPKLKALLSAFSAFTTDYLAEESQASENNTADNDNENNDANMNDDNDDIHAFLGMVGALKE
jgi:hypothetical protein